MRTCPKCQQLLPLSAFGSQRRCRQCVNEVHRKHRRKAAALKAAALKPTLLEQLEVQRVWRPIGNT